MAFLKYIKFILAVTIVQYPRPTHAVGFVEPILDLLQLDSEEPPDVGTVLDEYDFIVVGAGTAGCVLASRLSEVARWNVLLIEAGGPENFIMDIPIMAVLLQFTSANWYYRTQRQASACLGMKDQRCHWPRGKVMGGSSVLNFMIHTRGNRRDYDGWSALGNEGWSYKDVLPYFKKSEDMAVEELAKDTEYHNTGGYLTVSYSPWHTQLGKAFLQAGLETGSHLVDYNGQNQTGFSYLQTNLRHGARLSSSRAFLHPVTNRPNLHVKKYSQVTRVLIDPRTKKAYGVEYISEGKVYTVRARKEVILSAGAINSPQILMVSGVGPKNHLKKLDIPCLANLRVGYNLQDHIALGGLTFLTNDSVSIVGEDVASNTDNIVDYVLRRSGPLSSAGGCDALAFVDTSRPNASDGYPDMELLFMGGSFASMDLFKHAFAIENTVYDRVWGPIKDRDSWMVFPMLMLPKSRGRIKLRSSNPLVKPLIYPNYLSHPDDVETILKGIKMVMRLAKTRAMQRYGSQLHDIPLPGCKKHKFASDDYWRCAMRHITQTIYHQSGTCKMGPAGDTTAVVDPRLRVYGIKGLRVIDASIMPFVPSAHTNAPTVMIGEKGSDLIKQDWAKS